MVTKYFELLFSGSIETKRVKPRQTAENNQAYNIYLHIEVQCLGHEIYLRNLSRIHTHTHTYIYIYIHICTHKYIYKYVGLFKIIVGVLTTCHTQFYSDSRIRIFYSIEQLSSFYYIPYRSSICATFVIQQGY